MPPSRHPKCLHFLATALFILFAAECLYAAPSPVKHVVVIVCDGLRPDSVTQKDMPTLFALSHQGTFFNHHHPVYLSSTEVNGTALATGSYPQHSGIVANNEYRPAIELLKPFGTEELEAVRKADALTSNRYLQMPTVAETIRRAGFRTVIAGTKPVVLLLDRSARPITDPAKDPVILFEGQGLTGLGDKPADADPTFPILADPAKSPNRDQDTWTTRTLITKLWAGDIPTFTTLWFSEPDFAQHGSGPGSDTALAALKSDDDNIAAVLKALDSAGVRDSTDVLVVSDHGFSTIERTINVTDVLTAAGFDAHLKFTQEPKTGQILVVPNGGSFSLYITGHEPSVIAGLVQFLQKSDFAGVIFTRDQLEGTFPLSLADLASKDAPDILVSMRWDDQTSKREMPGMLFSCATKFHPGQGYHASLSRFDMHNTLIASGPDFKKSFVDQTPTGNLDVAPTVLALLGNPQEKPMDGRVLSEAFADSSKAGTAPTPITETIETKLDFGSRHWHQYLQITRVGSTAYFDEGNGSSSAIDTAASESQPHLRDWTHYPAIVRVHTTHDIYAIGDIHGDFDAMSRALASAHLIASPANSPAQLRWTGGENVLVCTGDLVDKWDHSLEVIAGLRNLQSQAQAAGGNLIVTMGNHEAEFLAGGKASADREPKAPTLSAELKSAGIKPADVRSGTDVQGIGTFLRNLPVGAEVNDIFFCHAGNTHGQTVAQLEQDVESQLDKKGFGATILSDPDSLLEARMHPTPWWETDAGKHKGEKYLRDSVAGLGAHHLVFGHQPGKVEFEDGTTRRKDTPFTKFDGLVFLIDTGMSRGQDSAPAAVLRFHRDGASHLTATVVFADGEVRNLWSDDQ
jgi:arylsulfatase A-like enzyme